MMSYRPEGVEPSAFAEAMIGFREQLLKSCGSDYALRESIMTTAMNNFLRGNGIRNDAKTEQTIRDFFGTPPESPEEVIQEYAALRALTLDSKEAAMLTKALNDAKTRFAEILRSQSPQVANPGNTRAAPASTPHAQQPQRSVSSVQANVAEANVAERSLQEWIREVIAKIKSPMTTLMILDFDGTLTAEEGSKTVFRGLYKSFFTTSAQYPLGEMLSKDEILNLLKAASNSDHAMHADYGSMLLTEDTKAFLRRVRDLPPGTQLMICSKNRSEYIEALLEHEGFGDLVVNGKIIISDITMVLGNGKDGVVEGALDALHAAGKIDDNTKFLVFDDDSKKKLTSKDQREGRTKPRNDFDRMKDAVTAYLNKLFGAIKDKDADKQLMVKTGATTVDARELTQDEFVNNRFDGRNVKLGGFSGELSATLTERLDDALQHEFVGKEEPIYVNAAQKDENDYANLDDVAAHRPVVEEEPEEPLYGNTGPLADANNPEQDKIPTESGAPSPSSMSTENTTPATSNTPDTVSDRSRSTSPLPSPPPFIASRPSSRVGDDEDGPPLPVKMNKTPSSFADKHPPSEPAPMRPVKQPPPLIKPKPVVATAPASKLSENEKPAEPKPVRVGGVQWPPPKKEEDDGGYKPPRLR